MTDKISKETKSTAKKSAEPTVDVKVKDSDKPEVVVSDEKKSQEGSSTISEPAKVMRIGQMIRQLLDEVKATELDEPGRDRLKEIYQTSVTELSSALSDDLRAELARLALPFDEGEVPTGPELRVAQAQLVGWLEGLFHGIQATLFAQQAGARRQLEQIQQSAGLPAGTPEESDSGGMYL